MRVRNQYNSASTVMYGYIALPTGVDRDKYVLDCLNRNVVTVQVEGAGQIRDCILSVSAKRDIKFPTDSKSLGSLVQLVSDSFHGKPVVSCVLFKSSDIDFVSENDFCQKSEVNGNNVAVSGNGSKGVLNIDVSSLSGDGV